MKTDPFRSTFWPARDAAAATICKTEAGYELKEAEILPARLAF